MSRFNTQTMKMIPSEHFLVKNLKATFDLSGLISLYQHVVDNFNTLDAEEKYEWNTGRATIIYALNKKENTINLITGWIGSRRKSL